MLPCARLCHTYAMRGFDSGSSCLSLTEDPPCFRSSVCLTMTAAQPQTSGAVRHSRPVFRDGGQELCRTLPRPDKCESWLWTFTVRTRAVPALSSGSQVANPPPLSLYPTGCACTSVMCEAHGRGLSPPGVDAALPGKGPSVVTDVGAALFSTGTRATGPMRAPARLQVLC